MNSVQQRRRASLVPNFIGENLLKREMVHEGLYHILLWDAPGSAAEHDRHDLPGGCLGEQWEERSRGTRLPQPCQDNRYITELGCLCHTLHLSLNECQLQPFDDRHVTVTHLCHLPLSAATMAGPNAAPLRSECCPGLVTAPGPLSP